MDPLSTAAIISGGLGLVGGLISHGDVKEQYKYNKKLQDNAFAHNVEMWNMQNAYNTPSAQMERLQAAGLNPNLVYGNGGATNTATDYPKYQAGEAPQVANIRNASRQLALQGFQTALNAKLQEAQAANLNADTELKGTQSQLTAVQKEIAMIDKQFQQGTLDKRTQFQLEKWKQDLILGRNQIKLGDQQVTLNQKQMEKLDAETNSIVSRTKLTDVQAEQISVIVQYLPQMLQSQINSNNANAYNAIQHGNLAIKEGNVADERVILTRYQTFTEFARGNLVRSEADIKEIEHYIASHTIDDVINSKHFESLDRQKQYQILMQFGALKAWRDAYGYGNSGLGGFATGASINLSKIIQDISGIQILPQ